MVLLRVMERVKNNKNLLMHFKGYEEFVSRILDLEDKAKRYRKVIFTPFLSVKEQAIVHQVVQGCFLYEDGGYANCEMKKMAFSVYEEEVSFPIVCLSDTYDAKYHRITHRDVLGAIMNLGIKRDVIGDIIVDETRIYIYVEDEMQRYLMQHLTQIKRCTINLKLYEGEVIRQEHIHYQERVVSSLRADVIVACIANVSREKAKNLIKGGKVKVDQVVLEDYDYLCNNNSTISIRGYGRFVLCDLAKKTKKDRLLVQIGKYL